MSFRVARCADVPILLPHWPIPRTAACMRCKKNKIKIQQLRYSKHSAIPDVSDAQATGIRPGGKYPFTTSSSAIKRRRSPRPPYATAHTSDHAPRCGHLHPDVFRAVGTGRSRAARRLFCRSSSSGSGTSGRRAAVISNRSLLPPFFSQHPAPFVFLAFPTGQIAADGDGTSS